MRYEELSKRARCAVDKIKALRASLPSTMLAAAERRVYAQYSVPDATDAALYLYEESKQEGVSR